MKPNTERNKPVFEQRVFQVGDQTIDLSKVVAFLEPLQPIDAPAKAASVMIHMVDGSNMIIYGDSDSRAFAQAMDNYLGVNLV